MYETPFLLLHICVHCSSVIVQCNRLSCPSMALIQINTENVLNVFFCYDCIGFGIGFCVACVNCAGCYSTLLHCSCTCTVFTPGMSVLL